MKKTRCRACESKLTPVFDLGRPHLANDFRRAGEGKAAAYPLKVLLCPKCHLAQLSVMVDPAILYSKYAYRSSESATMKAHFDTLYRDLKAYTPIKRVLEIGSNTGALLKRFTELGAGLVMGLDPAQNMVAIAQANFIRTIAGFFSKKWAEFYVGNIIPPDLILARHVFCHVDDWQDFIAGLELLATPETVVAIEVPYCNDMLSTGAFDTIYHEHLSYMTITAMDELLTNTGFELIALKFYPVLGSSILMLLKLKGATVEGPVELQLELETAIDYALEWRLFGERVAGTMQDLKNLVKTERGKGKIICGYGASAKSSVWINACGFDRDDIAFITDTTPEKQGTFSPGTLIPIVTPDRLKDADLAILFAWNYEKEIIAQEKEFRAQGGKFIIPVPALRVV